MAITKITKSFIDQLIPSKSPQFIWDSDISGFGLKLNPSGSKVFILQYRIAEPTKAMHTAPIRYTIGKYGTYTLAQARDEAKKLLGKVAEGIDPRDQKKAVIEAKKRVVEDERIVNEMAFDRLAIRWLEYYQIEKQRRPSSVNLARTVVTAYLIPRFGDEPLPKIVKSDIQKLIDSIPDQKRAMKRQVFIYASLLWKWALHREYVETNPFTIMEKPAAPVSRDRVLDDKEIATIWQATYNDAQPFGVMYRLLFLTGKRISEVSNADWSEFDREGRLWTIPKSRAKNGQIDLVSLTDAMITEIDSIVQDTKWPVSGYVLSTTDGRRPISGISKAKKRLDNVSSVHGWRNHDIRRTVATGLQQLGIRLEVTEAILSHKSGSKGGVVGVYQRYDWADEKRAALKVWSERLMEIVNVRELKNG